MKSETSTPKPSRPQAASHRQCDSDCLKLISYLLQYPDEAFLAELPALRPIIDTWPDPTARRSLRRVFEYLSISDPLTVQEAYTTAFDLNPDTCMNLTYHLWGDDEKRGRGLAQLQQMYRNCGYEYAGSDLPDHLPLLLEFCSQQPQWVDDALCGRMLNVIGRLATRLTERKNPYGRLFEIAARQVGAQEDSAADSAYPETNEPETSP